MSELLLPPNPISAVLASEYGVINKVNLSTLRTTDAPLVLRIGWEGMRRADRDTHAHIYDRRPDSIRVVRANWESSAEIESWLEECAWALGAGYLMRWIHAPSNKVTMGIRRSFGDEIYTINGESLSAGDSPRDEMFGVAARDGFIEWEFNSAYLRHESTFPAQLEAWRRHDATLLPSGNRDTIFPGWRDGKWTRIAKDFDTPTDTNTAKEVGYDFTKLRVKGVWDVEVMGS
ncbi:MAG: hypothetical protein MSG64_16715 [Pyrinomonadaceae bacterium MAG19_C2-C3]|nr:hypothetical protein [Pyrinomonadaceae bacterium MAG19_C2-C3]